MPAFDTITSTLPNARTACAMKSVAVAGSAREVDRDVGAVLCCADRNGAADAGGGAGDDHRLAFEQFHRIPLRRSIVL
jgi:hypothetical protein